MKPIAVKPKAPAPVKPTSSSASTGEAGNQVVSLITDDGSYKTLTKYSFHESGEKYVKVLLDFPDAKKLLTKDKVTCTFEVRSFEILIHDYKGENYKFAVPKLHCRIAPPDCSFSFKSNNVQITLRKKRDGDNWWSLFKQKAVGEKEGDSEKE